VVTAFKFRVRPYTQQIWAGPILLPNKQEVLKKVAKGIISMDFDDRDPKIAMFLYLMRKEIIESMGGKDDMLVVHAFDANGEKHGREAFSWALNLEGAIDMTGLKNLREVADLQGNYHRVQDGARQVITDLNVSKHPLATLKALQPGTGHLW
jgi:hypothetical protein